AVARRGRKNPRAHLLMKTPQCARISQRIIRSPKKPVKGPPVRKETRRGLRLEKSFEGETTFAATLVLSVAMSKATSAIEAITGSWKRPSKATGSQTGWPKRTTEAEVTATPMRE